MSLGAPRDKQVERKVYEGERFFNDAGAALSLPELVMRQKLQSIE